MKTVIQATLSDTELMLVVSGLILVTACMNPKDRIGLDAAIKGATRSWVINGGLESWHELAQRLIKLGDAAGL